jgi:hypothetical protein
MTPRKLIAISTAAACSLVLCAGLTACKKEEPPPPPPRPKAPPPPPPPKPIEVSGLMRELGADARLDFPQEQAPTSHDLASNAIRFADAFARGDDGDLRPMLDSFGQTVLADLKASASWSESVGRIEKVRITYLEGSDSGGTLAMAIQEPDGAYVLGWSMISDGDAMVFSPMPTSRDLRPRASQWDGQYPSMSVASFTPDFDMDLTGSEMTMDSEPEDVPPTERDPNRKNTPAGPITIPDGG